MKQQREPGWAPSALDVFRSMTWLNLAICGAVTVLGAGIGFLVSVPVGWGWLMGAGVATGSVVFTLAVMIATEKLDVRNEVATMAGSYLVKVILLIAILLIIRGKEFYSPLAFFLGFLIVLVVNLAVDSVVIIRSRG